MAIAAAGSDAVVGPMPAPAPGEGGQAVEEATPAPIVVPQLPQADLRRQALLDRIRAKARRHEASVNPAGMHT